MKQQPQIQTEQVSAFDDSVRSFIKSPLFQFATNNSKTTFRLLQKNNIFENESVLNLFDGARLTNEFEVPFNNILKAEGLLLEGDEA